MVDFLDCRIQKALLVCRKSGVWDVRNSAQAGLWNLNRLSGSNAGFNHRLWLQSGLTIVLL